MAFLTWLGAWLQRHSGKAPAKQARCSRCRRGQLRLERLEERLAPAVGWSSAANMATARSDATATLLGNGDVLVAGGVNGSGALSSAELYNPVSNSWSSAGNMVTARYFATATLLGDGDVLVAGGNGQSAQWLSSAELYDPVSNAWSSAGNMATGRAFATATLLGNGKVLVAGGWGTGDPRPTILSSAELYNPVTNAWSSTGSLATARRDATATLLGNGDVLVAGGLTPYVGESTNVVGAAELYNPTSRTWSSGGTETTGGESAATATLLGDGDVLVAGGNDGDGGYSNAADFYNPVSNTWSTAGSMATGRLSDTAALLGNGDVLVEGGTGNSGYLSSAEQYNPVTNSWSSAGNMSDPRAGATATLLANGDVLVAGGYNPNSGQLSSADLYIPDGPADLALSVVAAAPNSFSSGNSTTVTLTTVDANGNKEFDGGMTVAFSLATGSADTSGGTFSTVTDNGDGTYSATFSSTVLGADYITASINGQALTSTPATVIVAAPFSLSQSTVSAAPTSFTTGGFTTVTLTPEDSYGNPNPSGITSVAFSLAAGSSGGTFGTITSNGNGTYTATVSSSVAGTDYITASINGQALTSTPATVTVSTLPITVSSVTVNGDTAPILSATESTAGAGTTVTISTDGPHGFSAGQAVSIVGVSIAGVLVPGYNGVFTITGVSNTSFTYTANQSGLGNATGGTATTDSSTTPGGGLLAGAQRSMVDSIVYKFNQAVNLAGNAFTIGLHPGVAGNATSVPTLSLATTDGGFTWIVTFSGTGVSGNSIADGVYDITLYDNAVSAMTGGGTLSANRTDTFWRLFGDFTGAATVNNIDRIRFNAAYASMAGAANFFAAFDDGVNGGGISGNITNIDRIIFNAQSGKAFTGFTATI